MRQKLVSGHTSNPSPAGSGSICRRPCSKKKKTTYRLPFLFFVSTNNAGGVPGRKLRTMRNIPSSTNGMLKSCPILRAIPSSKPTWFSFTNSMRNLEKNIPMKKIPSSSPSYIFGSAYLYITNNTIPVHK